MIETGRSSAFQKMCSFVGADPEGLSSRHRNSVDLPRHTFCNLL